jgi:hypothetical protein
MVIQKTWTDLLGKPQGNEYVDDKDIVGKIIYSGENNDRKSATTSN